MRRGAFSPASRLATVLRNKRAVGRLHQIGDLAAHQLRGLKPDQAGRRFVGQENLLVVNQDDLGKGACEILEQPVTALDFLVAFTERIEQSIDGLRELRRFRIVRNRRGGGLPTHLAMPPAFRH